MFDTQNKSTFNNDMVIQNHLLRDRLHQGIGIRRKNVLICVMARLESTEKQQAS